jgi:hypothetical protein
MSQPAFDLLPGFKVAPNDPSREVKRTGVTIAHEPPEADMGEFDDQDRDPCEFCDDFGYVDCHCGGDNCICNYNGEIPCFHCA